LDISLVIPCFNEAKNLPFLYKKLLKLLDNKKIEIIIVDNGSSDDTYSLLKSYQVDNKNLKVLKINKNIGYGNGIIEGLKVANGDILSWTHADMQTDPNDILRGLKFFNHHKKGIFVKGLRKGRPFLDKLFTFFMSIYCSLRLGNFYRDINAQPVMFHSSFFQSWVNPPKDFSLDLYAYFMAKKLNYKIYKFPVIFSKRLFGVSSWNIDFPSKLKFIDRTIKFTYNLAQKYK
tara:strand:+ start:2161 stop:2856 length:696 start_codon:yes stop_codon:yes gene_type:complete